MQALITGAWLAEYPADVAMTNMGGLWEDIKPGDITLSDIIGVMPFDDVSFYFLLYDTSRILNT